MDVLSALLVAALAAQAAVELVNHAQIASGLRLVGDWAEDRRFWGWRLLLTPLRAVHCPYCFSHWAGAAACAGLWWAWPGIGWELAAILWLPTVRLSNIFNDLLGARSRTPGRSEDPRLSEASPEEVEMRLLELTGRALDDE